MNRRLAVWAAIFAVGAAWEIHEVVDPQGVPLTHVVRRVFRTNTPVGRAVFVRSADWFVHHILNERTTTT